MESALPFIESLVSLVVTALLIILIFLFVVKPILNYLVVNREIEIRKKLAMEYEIAKRKAEASRKEHTGEEGNWSFGAEQVATPAPVKPTESASPAPADEQPPDAN